MLPHISINVLPQEDHMTSQDAQFSQAPVPGIVQMPVGGSMMRYRAKLTTQRSRA
jgi:hypothetical protein